MNQLKGRNRSVFESRWLNPLWLKGAVKSPHHGYPRPLEGSNFHQTRSDQLAPEPKRFLLKPKALGIEMIYWHCSFPSCHRLKLLVCDPIWDPPSWTLCAPDSQALLRIGDKTIFFLPIFRRWWNGQKTQKAVIKSKWILNRAISTTFSRFATFQTHHSDEMPCKGVW